MNVFFVSSGVKHARILEQVLICTLRNETPYRVSDYLHASSCQRLKKRRIYQEISQE